MNKMGPACVGSGNRHREDGQVSRTAWAWTRLLGGFAILAVIAWRLGTGPFLDGLRAIDVTAVVAAVLITAATTVCCAWRWRVVARGLGVGLPLGTAVAAYYRSQFLNTALPGGVLGDVHRGVDHGRSAGDVGRGLRAVAWERIAGQVVQLGVAVVVLAVLPSPVRSALPTVLAVSVAAALLVALGLWRSPRHGVTRWARAWRAAATDVREGVLARTAWPTITVSSVLVVVGHVAVFVIAARAAGVTAPVDRLLPLALLALLAAAVPANIGGWGPREGVAAWAFAAAGLGAERGVATATAFGVLVLISSLPGVVVLLAGATRRSTPPAEAPPRELIGASHG
jgi:uncharacterized membrane protein YbhN (UPF0104 family)